MTLVLYDDQIDLREKLRVSMKKHKCILVHAATGFGKTVLTADIISRLVAHGNPSLFSVPRRQLLWQTSEKFDQFDIDYGYITSGKKRKDSLVQLATLGSVVTRMDSIAPTVVVIDEGHHSFEQTKVLAEHYLKAGAWVIYLTATPKPGMDCIVQDVVAGHSVRWMIDRKRLSEYRAFSPSAPDLSMMPKVAGEWHQGKLSDKMEHDRALVGNMVKHWRNLAPGRKTLGYGTSIAHAEMMAHEFREAGIPSQAISGETPDTDLVSRIKAFAMGEIKVLMSCDLATFGFDLSAASGMDVTVEAMIDGGPTLSITKQSQKWGRVLRMKDDPAILLDHAGNINHRDGTRNHGLPCDDRLWPIATGATAGVAARAMPIKQCPACLGNHRPAPECTLCGHVYKIDGRVIRQEDGTLVEVHKSEVVVKPEFDAAQMVAIRTMQKQMIDRGVHPVHALNAAKKRVRGLR